MSDGELLVRVLVALGLGVALGLERELRGHEAGIGTHALVALGAAVFTIAGVVGFVPEEGTNRDPMRIAAQVASGIGFIGAGTILRARGSIKGLTTAATLWFAAALGVLSGAGGLRLAAAATGAAILLLVVRELVPVRPLRQRVTGYIVTVRHNGRDDLRLDVPALLASVRGPVTVETHPESGVDGAGRWRTVVHLGDRRALEPVLNRLEETGAARELTVERW